MNQNQFSGAAVKTTSLKSRLGFNLALPIVMILLLILGWTAVNSQFDTVVNATIKAYQKSELEIVRVAARSIQRYVEDQIRYHGGNDETQIEQNIFRLYIEPIRLLKNGDAWIYAPDHVVFDLSEDFPDEYRGKSMARIFEIQKEYGASHYQEMTNAVINTREGVGWYIWLPDKGREIAAWTPVKVGNYIWTIGLSVPLPEILEETGVANQIETTRLYMKIVTVASVIFLIAWGYGAWSREKTSHDLNISRQTMRTVLDTIPQAICWKDRRFVFKGCNQNFAKLIGRDNPEDLIGSQTPINTSRTDDFRSFLETDRQILSQKEPVLHHLFSIQARKGEEIWLETNRVPMLDPQGNAFGVMVMYEDVTERREKEIELHQLRELLSAVVNSMPSILIGVDPKGVITQWNKEAERETGVPESEAKGKLLERVFPKLADIMLQSDAYRDLDNPRKIERIKVNRDSGAVYWDITIYPLQTENARGSVIRIDDVTDRVHVDEIMIQTEKMASVGGLAAGVAHEINNPLAGILQNAQVLLKRATTDLPANAKAAAEVGVSMDMIKEYLRSRDIPKICSNILEGSRRAATIVENMLSFSRQSDTRFSRCDLKELINVTLDLASNDFDLKNHTDFKHIEINKELDESTPEIKCEKSEIQQVLLNLIKNAVQALTEAKVEFPKISIRLYAKNRMVCIEVEDNGPGMSDEVRKRVFEPFFTTKEVGSGVGLGMSVSYFIITENHGGTFTLETAVGQGAKFTIQLPLMD